MEPIPVRIVVAAFPSEGSASKALDAHTDEQQLGRM
jgi:hypothetical protein